MGMDANGAALIWPSWLEGLVCPAPATYRIISNLAPLDSTRNSAVKSPLNTPEDLHTARVYRDLNRIGLERRCIEPVLW